MARIHNYNKEKKDKGFSDVYLMALLFGLLAGFMFIGGGMGLILLLEWSIKYWVWIVVMVVVVIFASKFFKRGRA